MSLRDSSFPHFQRILLAAIVLPVALGACGDKTMFEYCTEFTEESHPAIGVPVLILGCIPAAAADQIIYGVVKPILSMPLGVASQIYSNLTAGGEPSPFLFHGEWCGPGNPEPGTHPKPLDDPLDRACMVHDLCYERLGYYNCKCDVELVRSIREDKNMPDDLIVKARAIANFFDDSYCEGCKQTRQGPGVGYVCHKPSEFGCKMGPVSRTKAYAWCPS